MKRAETSIPSSYYDADLIRKSLQNSKKNRKSSNAKKLPQPNAKLLELSKQFTSDTDTTTTSTDQSKDSKTIIRG